MYDVCPPMRNCYHVERNDLPSITVHRHRSPSSQSIYNKHTQTCLTSPVFNHPTMLSSVCRKLASKCSVTSSSTGSVVLPRHCLSVSSVATVAPPLTSSTISRTSSSLSTVSSSSTDNDLIFARNSNTSLISVSPLSSSTSGMIQVQKRLKSTTAIASLKTDGVGNSRSGDDYVSVLKLNMLRDNPGAVKKVRFENTIFIVFFVSNHQRGEGKQPFRSVVCVSDYPRFFVHVETNIFSIRTFETSCASSSESLSFHVYVTVLPKNDDRQYRIEKTCRSWNWFRPG